jgi:hypothetical protein
MKRWFPHLCLVVLICLLNGGVCYGQGAFGKAMEQIFGDQFKGYQWLPYPVDNFGMGSMFEAVAPLRGKQKTSSINIQPINARLLCSTFDCLGIKPAPKPRVDPKSLDQWLYLAKDAEGNDPYADLACGGELQLKDFGKKSKVAVKFLLPQILGVIGIQGDFSSDNSIALNGTLSVACDRRLLPARIKSYFKALGDDNYGIKEAFNSGQLILIENDVIIKSVDLKVTRGSELAAKLDNTLKGQPAKVFGEGANFGVQVSRSENGDYTLKNSSPLIVGVLARQQIRGAGIGPSELDYDITKWQRVRIKGLSEKTPTQ